MNSSEMKSLLAEKNAELKNLLEKPESERTEYFRDCVSQIKNVISVCNAIMQLNGIPLKQALTEFSYEFALDGVVYVSSPKLSGELIKSAKNVNLKLVGRNGVPLN